MTKWKAGLKEAHFKERYFDHGSATTKISSFQVLRHQGLLSRVDEFVFTGCAISQQQKQIIRSACDVDCRFTGRRASNQGSGMKLDHCPG